MLLQVESGFASSASPTGSNHHNCEREEVPPFISMASTSRVDGKRFLPWERTGFQQGGHAVPVGVEPKTSKPISRMLLSWATASSASDMHVGGV